MLPSKPRLSWGHTFVLSQRFYLVHGPMLPFHDQVWLISTAENFLGLHTTLRFPCHTGNPWFRITHCKQRLAIRIQPGHILLSHWIKQLFLINQQKQYIYRRISHINPFSLINNQHLVSIHSSYISWNQPSSNNNKNRTKLLPNLISLGSHSRYTLLKKTPQITDKNKSTKITTNVYFTHKNYLPQFTPFH